MLGKTLQSPLVFKEMKPIIKEIDLKYYLEGLFLKLKLQYFGHLMWRASSLEKTSMMGKIEGKRRRGQQRIRWKDSITDSKDMNLSKLWGIVEDREACHATVPGDSKGQTGLRLSSNNIGVLLVIYSFNRHWRTSKNFFFNHSMLCESTTA